MENTCLAIRFKSNTKVGARFCDDFEDSHFREINNTVILEGNYGLTYEEDPDGIPEDDSSEVLQDRITRVVNILLDTGLE